MKRLNNYSVFEVSGLNYEALLNKLIKYNIKVIDARKTQQNKLILTVENKNIKKLIAVMGGSCYNISRIKNYGIQTMLNNILKHAGILIGIVICFMLMVLNSQLITSVEISGLQRIEKNIIQQVLNQNNIGIFSLKHKINTKQLETQLLSNIEDLSIASVNIKGTTLQINLKEKIYVDILDGETYNITAPNDAIITALTVTQGTALYKVGDSVKKGDIIVAGYKLAENGEKLPLKAVAAVEINAFISSKVEVSNTKTVLERTGNKEIKKCYYFNKQKLFNKQTSSSYNLYEVEERTEKVFNMLPFYVTTYTYYECSANKQTIDFESEKENIKKQLQYQTYEKINENDEIIEEKFYITKQNEYNIVVFTLTLKKKIS